MTKLKVRARRERWARNVCYYLDTKADNFVFCVLHPVMAYRVHQMLKTYRFMA